MYLLTSALEAARTTPSGALLFDQVSPASIFRHVFSDGDSQLQRWSSLIGIVTAIIGNILISFALNIQRYAHIKLEREGIERREKARNAAKASQVAYNATSDLNLHGTHGGAETDYHDEEDDPLEQSFHSTDSQLSSHLYEGQKNDSNYLHSPYWWGGIVLMTLGEAGNFLAYGFAPASIVSPLGVVALISNCVIAPIMLKEAFRMRDFWGVVIAVAGAVTVVLSSKQQEKKLGPHEIWDAITTTEFEVYMGITIALVGILIWASPKYGSRTILIDLGLVGLFGGYTALSTKGVASMLSFTFWRAFATPVTYALLAVLIGTAVMQVKYVNNALQRFDSTQVIPVQFVMFTLSVIIGSAVLYRDFEKATPDKFVKFIGGCLLTFFGVYLITSGRSRVDHNEDEESFEEREERIRLADQDPTRDDIPYTDNIRNQSSTRRAHHNRDSVNYPDDDEESRRSSRISFAEPSPPPRSPGVNSNSQYQPPARIKSSKPSIQSLRAEETPRLNNPWRGVVDETQSVRPLGMHGTHSSPVLPIDAQAATSDPDGPSIVDSASQSNVYTAPHGQQVPVLQAERAVTPARHSISRVMPGQLISPLSGGLSVVVTDSLRRGIDSPLRNKSVRRNRASIDRSRYGSQRIPPGADEVTGALGTSLPKNGTEANAVSQSVGPERPKWTTITRARSLSTTLGDLFLGKGPKEERADPGDEEAGPSGT